MKAKALRIGIVGTSSIAHQLASAARQSKELLLHSVYSRTEESGRAFADVEGIPHIFCDYGSFLSDAELDAVYIASPNALHAPQALSALRCGKHVLLEKPVTSSLAEFRRLRAEAEARGLVLMEGMRPLHDPAFGIIRKSIGRLGRIRRVDFEFCQYSSRYDRFLSGELPNAFDPTLSNAAVMDIGVYPISLLVALFGEPSSVASSSLFLESGFEGAGELICRYPDMLATVSYSKISESVAPSVVTGEGGSLTVDRINSPRRLTLSLRGEPSVTLAYEPSENNMIFELTDFVRAVRGEISEKPYSDVTEKTMELLDTVRRQNGIVFPSDEIPL